MARLSLSYLKPRHLTLYVGKLYVVRFLVVLLGLALLLQTLDVLAQTGEVLAPQGADSSSLWRYALLRFPALVSSMVVFAALIAAIIVSATLHQHSEVIIMQAAGQSSFQIARPMILVCAVIAVGHFVFNETIVVDSNREFERWQESGYRPGATELPALPTDAWLTDGDTIVRVGGVNREGIILDDVSIYYRDEDGDMSAIVASKFAVHNPGGWTLFDAAVFHPDENETRNIQSYEWRTEIPPERFVALSVKPQTVSFGRLEDTIDYLEGEGQVVTTLRAWQHQKIAGPLGTLLMPLLGCLAAFGVARAGHVFQRIIAAAALGFSFFLFDNFMLAIGQFGTMPPAMAAWAPILLFAGIGSGVLIFTEE